jgi:hypothetical protein
MLHLTLIDIEAPGAEERRRLEPTGDEALRGIGGAMEQL